MALAILTFDEDAGFDGPEGGRAQFVAEIGTNRFFQWAVGDGNVTRTDGLNVLANRKHVSDVMGPIEEASRGRVSFSVPGELFDRENQHVQLMSYRTADRTGPAISDVVTVPVVGVGRDGRAGPHGDRAGYE